VFDFRYHVASLIAVFIALVIGILIGIGLSGKGFVSDAERKNLEHEISALTSDRNTARAQLADVTRQQAATAHYADQTYAALVKDRLDKLRVAVVYLGSVDETVDGAVTQAIHAAGGRVLRTRALRIPIDVKAVERIVSSRPALRGYAGAARARDLGHDIGAELVVGGKTPLLDALGDVLLEEREGGGQAPVDGVVVARPAPPQQGFTHEFLLGIYSGLANSGVPAVGVERSAPATSAIKAFSRGGLSTVDSIETSAGRLALVLELSGAGSGHYGVEPTATSGLLPPVTPLVLTTGG
jgi:Copper transport outer membrane protein, MctB